MSTRRTKILRGSFLLPRIAIKASYHYTDTHMSFLFDKRTKKVLKIAWAIVAVLIIVSMVVFFAPIPGLTVPA